MCVDIIVTRGEHEPPLNDLMYSLRGCNVHVNPYQPSVNHARLLAMETGTCDYIMWLDPDDKLDLVLLQNMLDEFNLTKPYIGIYSPIINRTRHGHEVAKCDLTKSIYPVETHMSFIVSREYAKRHYDYFKSFIWGDHLLRVKLLTEEHGFIRYKEGVTTWSMWMSHGGRSGVECPLETGDCIRYGHHIKKGTEHLFKPNKK